MKKVLLATTALVATAGIAAADVTVAGNGRMGLTYDESAGTNVGGSSDKINFTSRVRVVFSLSGETDGGLAFGGSIRADNAGAGASGSAGSINMSGAFGKLSMGDVGGAAEAAVGDLAGVGMTGVGDYNEQFYLMQGDDPDGDGNSDLGYSNPAALYEYSSGDFAIYVGVGDIGGTNITISGITLTTTVGTTTTALTGLNLGNQFSVGGSYSFGDFTLSAGYENMDTTVVGISSTLLTSSAVSTSVNDDAWILGGSYSIADTTIKGVYGQGSILNRDTKQYGLSVASTFGATSVSAFWNHKEISAGGVLATLAASSDNYGIGGAYDLGGGASIVAGVAGGDAPTRADFGITFSF